MNVKRSMTLRLAVLSMPSVFMFHTFPNIDFMFTNWHIKFSDPYYCLVLLNMPLCVELSVYIVINCPNVHYTCQCNFKPKSNKQAYFVILNLIQLIDSDRIRNNEVRIQITRDYCCQIFVSYPLNYVEHHALPGNVRRIQSSHHLKYVIVLNISYDHICKTRMVDQKYKYLFS